MVHHYNTNVVVTNEHGQVLVTRVFVHVVGSSVGFRERPEVFDHDIGF